MTAPTDPTIPGTAMFIACTLCSRQYDVGDMPPGRRLRCACGALIITPEPEVKDLPMQRCAACGGALAPGSSACTYCTAGVTLETRGWGASCPSCHARMVKGARFCSSCGIAIRANPVRKSPTNQVCPRCEEALAVCTLSEGHFTECTGCGGVWLQEADFAQLTDRQDRAGAMSHVFATPERIQEALASTRIADSAYLKCPVCSKHMNRMNFARISGIIIDRCKGHGYWFDTHELERVFAFISEGGMDKARSREVERQREEIRRHRELAARTQRMARRVQAEPGHTPMYGAMHATSPTVSLLQTIHSWLFG